MARILIVEDEERIASFVAKGLHAEGHSTTVVADGREGLDEALSDDYDLMVLAPTIAFLAAHGMARGFAPYEKSALGLLWLTPLIARSAAENLLMPLGVIAMIAVFGLILWKAGARSHQPYGSAAPLLRG